MKVKELIEMLNIFNGDTEILIRRPHEHGYFTDHEIQINIFYPDNGVRITMGEMPATQGAVDGE